MSEAVKRRGIDYYRAILATRGRDSNETVEKFCERHAISPWTYYYWRKRIVMMDPGLAPTPRHAHPGFVRIETITGSYSQIAAVEVVFPNGLILRTSTPVDRGLLSEIAAAERA